MLLQLTKLDHAVFVAGWMLLTLNESNRQDGSLIGIIASVPGLVGFIALVSGLLLLEFDCILLGGENIVRFINAAFRSFFLVFEFLEHRLNPFVLVIWMSSRMRILLSNFLIALCDLSLTELLLGLFHEPSEHLLCVLLAFLPQVLLDKLVKSKLLRLVQLVVAI